MIFAAFITLGIIFIPKMITDKFENSCIDLLKYSNNSKKINKSNVNKTKLKKLCNKVKDSCKGSIYPNYYSLIHCDGDCLGFTGKAAGYYVTSEQLQVGGATPIMNCIF